MQTSGLQLNEWLARLETYSAQEIDLGLERVQVLLQRLNLTLPKNSVLTPAGSDFQPRRTSGKSDRVRPSRGSGSHLGRKKLVAPRVKRSAISTATGFPGNGADFAT